MVEKIVATIEKVSGKCRFWKKGDEIHFIVDTHSRIIGLDMKKTSGKTACVIALSTIFPYVMTRKTWTSKMEYGCMMLLSRPRPGVRRLRRRRLQDRQETRSEPERPEWRQPGLNEE